MSLEDIFLFRILIFSEHGLHANIRFKYPAPTMVSMKAGFCQTKVFTDKSFSVEILSVERTCLCSELIYTDIDFHLNLVSYSLHRQ